MAGHLAGFTGKGIDTDPGRNLFRHRGNVNFLTGTSYCVTGGPSNYVTTSIASGTTLISLRHGTTASNDLFISRMVFTVNVSTTGSSGGVPGEVVWERFTTATPTGGTQRTPAKKDATEGASQVMDVRDHSASLSMTGVVKGSAFLFHPIPNTVNAILYTSDLDNDEFIRLQPGDGIALTVSTAGPAVQTWTYTYVIHWYEGV